MDLLQLATQNLFTHIKGRYVTNEVVFNFLKTLNDDFKISDIGQSVLGKTIKSVQVGNGKIKVLMWSQMHGNESTTTKGLIDFLSYLNTDDNIAQKIKENYTLYCIPILNPDGAELYTRENANKVDLNRDAKNKTQPESIILNSIYLNFQPNICFNLHDQRTIFAAGDSKLPATMSFLAPAYNSKREYNDVRLKAVAIINAINSELKKVIPNQIGRYDDAFNENCIGDYLTTLNIPTILFEAGHYQDDYQRDEVRKFVFISIVSALLKLDFDFNDFDNELDDYLKIPQNKVCFQDFLYKNIKINDGGNEKIVNFAAHFKEVLKNSKIEFEAKISQVDSSETTIGHFEFDGMKFEFDSEFGKKPVIDKKADFSLNKMLKFHNGLQIN